ncbi:MAG: ribosomal-protein-alanine N-acetyltransferase [Chloroflexi bacterium]|nr:ribosomal-protein-alanine N-acetyltransferase [Chloroflexota bacterium]
MNLQGLPYRVTPMRVRHVPTITDIERAVFTLPWSATSFRYEILHNSSSEYILVQYRPWMDGSKGSPGGLLGPLKGMLRAPRDDVSILGYAGLWIIADEAHVCTIAVRPEWRGRGLGELLLASLIERALDRRADVVTLEVRASNVVAQNLYAKYGFAVVGRRRRYYSDNGEDALIMTTDSIRFDAYQSRFRELEAALRIRLATHQDPPSQDMAAAR